jgi:MoaA/NifB/PqqE/SkfB family radical SAM enzyme
MATTKELAKESAAVLIDQVLKNNGLRRLARDHAIKAAYQSSMEDGYPSRIKEAEFLGKRNLILVVDKALQNNRLAPAVRKHLLKNMVGRVLVPNNDIRNAFIRKYGVAPPGFLTISPSAHCNLFCEGCYAGSSNREKANIDYDVLARVFEEKEKFWASYFTVISGGEPLMWRSRGKDIFDLYSRFHDQYFLMYTNGTLINPEVAGRLAELGNVTPAVSMEGFAEQTDARRGKGTFDRIMAAFEAMRNKGVPFGVSLTATRGNVDMLMSDEFVDFCFNQQGAIYAWFFHYMPIGRDQDFDRMITPEQRVRLWERQEYFMREKGLFLVDFWNGGPISHGCVAAGRRGGQFYINWNGDVAPCAFFPFSTHNIAKVYEEGGDLNTALFSSLFREVREWQWKYGFAEDCQTMVPRIGNWLRPCPIRDHHSMAREWVRRHQAHPIDDAARAIIADEHYCGLLTAYGDRVGELTEGIWERDYLREEGPDQSLRPH